MALPRLWSFVVYRGDPGKKFIFSLNLSDIRILPNFPFFVYEPEFFYTKVAVKGDTIFIIENVREYIRIYFSQIH